MNKDLKQHCARFSALGIRLDGRRFEEYRPVEVEYGISNSAEGSARVKIGTTEVLAGVKLSIEKPYPDAPEKGSLSVNVELLPLSNPKFESGPPGIDSIELARVVDRSIRESEAIDMEALCVKTGEKVWIVNIDICTLNDAGNLFDASALAALAALRDTRFPEYDEEKNAINYDKKTDRKLPVRNMPLSVTVLKLGNVLIVDPISEEESAADARLTVGSLDEDTMCALQKGGSAPLTSEEIGKMVEMGLKHGAFLRKHI
ncbi:exosome complex protein Rrp42 [Candidatus Woesearchaeota archaeon]|nr:exosome complex protein Rrp42 [Candidatus Woesearchaeota archaeon]